MRTLDNGPDINRIGLGSWVFGKKNWGYVDDNNSVKVVHEAVERGITFFDTSPVYGLGHAEILLGETIKAYRHRLTLATKCGLRQTSHGIIHDLSESFVIEECESSLKRLQTDFIDLFQLHWPDPGTPLEKTAEALLRLQAQGKIKNIGLCNFTLSQTIEAQKLFPVSSLQIQHSLLKSNAELIKQAAEQHLTTIAYGVLHGGLLTGKYKEQPNAATKTAKAFFYNINDPALWKKAAELTRELELQAAEHKRTIPAEVIRAIQDSGVSLVLMGCRNIQQLKENLNII